MTDLYTLAVEHSKSMGGALSPQEVLDVWKRHPEFAPGSPLWTMAKFDDGVDHEYPCSWCDYVFTLIMVAALTAALSYFDASMWVIVFVVHAFTCRWFFDTRN